MLPALIGTFQGFPLLFLDGVSHRRGCFRGAHCAQDISVNIISGYFYDCSECSIARKAIKQDFTHNYSPGMKFDDLQKISGD